MCQTGESGSISEGDRQRRVADRLREELGPERYGRYFGGGTRLDVRGDRVEVAVASPFMAELVQRRCGTTLRRVASDGNTLAEVRVRVDRSLASPITPAEPAPTARPAPRPPRRRAPALRHKLAEFVVGESNRLAHAAACRLAEGVDDAAFSPLFVHGPSGVGKTHLLQGVAGRFLERRPGARVRYTTAETFTNDYIHAIRNNATDVLRRDLRRLDLLCLDDVHFLGGKGSTQGELLHTLDAIVGSGARVMLASDEHPRSIEALSTHLTSRFLSGAVVRIDEPDAGLCGELIAVLARRRELVLTADAVAVLAHRAAETATRSVREVEGLLNQVEAVRRLTPDLCGGSGPMDGGSVRRALGLSEGVASRRGSRRPVQAQAILREVCDLLRVAPEDLYGRGRHRRVVLARGLIVRLARELTTLSYPEIARLLRRPNHSTVITADQRIGRQVEQHEQAGRGAGMEGLTVGDLLTRARARVLDPSGR